MVIIEGYAEGEFERNDIEGRKRSWGKSYETADIATEYLCNRLQVHRLIPKECGIDNRFEDMSSEKIEGKPDLLVQHPSVTIDGITDVGYIEVKAKQNENWMFICNQYQWEKYVDFSTVRNIPVFIGWIHVDDDEQRIYDEQYVLVESFEQVERAFTAPDGNVVVVINDDNAHTFDGMKELLLSEMDTN